MAEFNYKIANGRNRALVCYCATDDGATMRDAIAAVFAAQNIDVEPFIDDGSETVWTIANVVRLVYSEPKTSLNIALHYADKIKRLKVGGEFRNVCVGVYFYNQPDPPEPEIVFVPTDELGNPIGEPVYEESESEPTPSVPDWVCAALQKELGGVYGASSFVVPSDVTAFELEVE